MYKAKNIVPTRYFIFDLEKLRVAGDKLYIYYPHNGKVKYLTMLSNYYGIYHINKALTKNRRKKRNRIDVKLW